MKKDADLISLSDELLTIIAKQLFLSEITSIARFVRVNKKFSAITKDALSQKTFLIDCLLNQIFILANLSSRFIDHNLINQMSTDLLYEFLTFMTLANNATHHSEIHNMINQILELADILNNNTMTFIINLAAAKIYYNLSTSTADLNFASGFNCAQTSFRLAEENSAINFTLAAYWRKIHLTSRETFFTSLEFMSEPQAYYKVTECYNGSVEFLKDIKRSLSLCYEYLRAAMTPNVSDLFSLIEKNQQLLLSFVHPNGKNVICLLEKFVQSGRVSYEDFLGLGPKKIHLLCDLQYHWLLDPKKYPWDTLLNITEDQLIEINKIKSSALREELFQKYIQNYIYFQTSKKRKHGAEPSLLIQEEDEQDITASHKKISF